MNLDEVLARLESIGQAFANDYNDGDGPAYEGVSVGGFPEEDMYLFYDATLEDDTKVRAVFRLELISLDEG